jgi:hypothetical protein
MVRRAFGSGRSSSRATGTASRSRGLLDRGDAKVENGALHGFLSPTLMIRQYHRRDGWQQPNAYLYSLFNKRFAPFCLDLKRRFRQGLLIQSGVAAESRSFRITRHSRGFRRGTTRSIPQLSAACLAAFQCHDRNCSNAHLGYISRSSSAVVNSSPYASNARVTARWLRPTRYDQFGGGRGIILGIRQPSLLSHEYISF